MTASTTQSGSGKKNGTGFLPYHPSPKDWSRPGTMRILEMPLFYDAHVPEDEHARHMIRSQWPILRLRGPDCFADLCRRMFVEQRNVERDSCRESKGKQA